MKPAQNPENLQDELQKVRNELALLYEISNAMRTTLKLDEILYIILTAVTAHVGLGFNRAMLFLVNEKDAILEGKMGIGPDTGEEANRIWTFIETQKMTLDDLISNYKSSEQLAHSQLNRFVTSLRLALKEEEGGVLAMTLFEGMPLHIKPNSGHILKQDRLIEALKPEEFVTVSSPPSSMGEGGSAGAQSRLGAPVLVLRATSFYMPREVQVKVGEKVVCSTQTARKNPTR